MRKEEEIPLSGNLTAMIDVVFQLIIFFVCTVKMQDDSVDARIRLAMAPHGVAVATKNPLQVTIDVDNRGRILLGNSLVEPNVLRAILKKAVADAHQAVPIIIRGDAKAPHKDIRRVMDVCTEAGLWKLEFAAYKEKG
ncbi:MAG: biopolymer transporter ExbD [bacterium]